MSRPTATAAASPCRLERALASVERGFEVEPRLARLGLLYLEVLALGGQLGHRYLPASKGREVRRRRAWHRSPTVRAP